MQILTISSDNHITAFTSAAEVPSAPEIQFFSSLEELIELAANWPASRLVEIWNNLADGPPVKKFTDRKTGLNRIWKALQSLGCEGGPDTEAATKSDSAEAGAIPDMVSTDDPDDTASLPSAGKPELSGVEEPNDAQPSNDVAPVATETSEEPTRAEEAPTNAPKPKRSREDSKTAVVLALLKREGGTTLSELMATTGWQKHSVRGFLSGTIGKKMGLTLVSVKGEDGQRTYSLAQ